MLLCPLLETHMEASAKETVIIVHGTFAGPKPEKRCWHQPGDGDPIGFIAKLNLALQKRLSGPLLGTLQPGDHEFSLVWEEQLG